MTNEELVRGYIDAMVRHDYDALDRLRHAQWTTLWPQSGEVVTSTGDFRQIIDHYPGGKPQLVNERLVGSEDRWAISPLGGAYRVAGEGENWWSEWRMIYPDGRIYWTVALLELREGKIFRETVYWAEPFEAPPWRADWVERVGEPSPAGVRRGDREADDPGPGPLG